VQRWADMIYDRPAVKRGRMVNRTSGKPSSQLHERHDASEVRRQNDIALFDLDFLTYPICNLN
jgi:GSH-dependent disulfide-bond oxidoreductase